MLNKFDKARDEVEEAFERGEIDVGEYEAQLQDIDDWEWTAY
tara:strand:+ start:1406 stop:1531 length:126 start_codon:yes stop_codon:yes gene_type:complete